MKVFKNPYIENFVIGMVCLVVILGMAFYTFPSESKAFFESIHHKIVRTFESPASCFSRKISDYSESWSIPYADQLLSGDSEMAYAFAQAYLKENSLKDMNTRNRKDFYLSLSTFIKYCE